ncbi:hypothetical protein CYMTET_21838 [Cymbomonas tetramitiformis]|uniref:SWIM-type domain-containing protein n=1 Tax=Cymbomonas tetramitiformis TaxID=36881 RepID=A0AAE0G185_9CHLO|nr:hypothetical protein CYMTET_21838 [Cymbomonas tetramitiformis]
MLAQRPDLRVDSLVLFMLEVVLVEFDSKYRRQQAMENISIARVKEATEFEPELLLFLDRRPWRVQAQLNDRYVSSKQIPPSYFTKLGPTTFVVKKSNRTLAYELDAMVASSSPTYSVDYELGTCSCPDHVTSGYICKHLFGVLAHDGKTADDLPDTLKASAILTLDLEVLERQPEGNACSPNTTPFYTTADDPMSARQQTRAELRTCIKHLNTVYYNTNDDNLEEVYKISARCSTELQAVMSSTEEFGANAWRRKRRSTDSGV